MSEEKKPLSDKIKKLLFEISVRPSDKSTKWQGRRSILATFVLWFIWLFRVLSILQWVKKAYRYIGEKKARSSHSITNSNNQRKFYKEFKVTKDKNATRIDVPPYIPEIYFLAWLLLFTIFKITGVNGIIIYGLCYYYIFETFVWILYYTIFRRFFEEEYTIYHSLEYFLPLIVIFPTQALALSILYSISFNTTILAILGNGTDQLPTYVNVVSILYGALVIGLVVGKFPEETIKKSEIKVHIIGDGNVVTERLLPALKNASYDEDEIAIYDTDKVASDKRKENVFYGTDDEIIKEITSKAEKDSIIFISSPSSTHVGYLEKLVKKTKSLVVCEKPICIDLEDLKIVEKLNDDPKYRDRIFYLSYYLLEKALPLNYFYGRDIRYARYLNIDGEIDKTRELLGNPKEVEIKLLEGSDNRILKDDGGQYFETLIHNVLMASLICNPIGNNNWKAEKPVRKDFETEMNILYHQNYGNSTDKLNEKSKLWNEINTNIHLYQKKNCSEVNRTAAIRYEHGNVDVDIDTGILTAKLSGEQDRAVKIAIKQEYKADKYSIQVDLVRRAALGEFVPEGVDWGKRQIEALKWMIDNQTPTSEK